MKAHHLNRRGKYVHPMATSWKPKVMRGTTANNHDGTRTDRPVKTGKPSRRQKQRMSA